MCRKYITYNRDESLNWNTCFGGFKKYQNVTGIIYILINKKSRRQKNRIINLYVLLLIQSKKNKTPQVFYYIIYIFTLRWKDFDYDPILCKW